jgi:hypothetical protein
MAGLQADSYESALAGWRRAAPLLCYHSLFFHENRVITEASRGEGCVLLPEQAAAEMALLTEVSTKLSAAIVAALPSKHRE